MGQEGAINVGFAEDENVLLRVEFHRTLKVCLMHFAVLLGPLEFYALRIYREAGAAPSYADDPCKTGVYEETRLLLVGQQPNELDEVFRATFDQAYLFRASELFVACQPLQCVPKGARVERGDRDWIVTLYTFLGPQLETDRGVLADFRNAPIQREHFFGGEQNLFLVEQSQGKARLPEHNHR
jgi:hypothetical protein